MHERGTVIAGRGDLVDVTVTPSGACGGCSVCSRREGGELVLTGVIDPLGARVGDTVEVEIPEGVRSRAAFAIYVVPVAGLFVGYLAGDLLSRALGGASDLAGAGGAVAGLAMALLAVRGVERRMLRARSVAPRVSAIIARVSGRT